MNMIPQPPHRPDAAAKAPVREALSVPDARPDEPPPGGGASPAAAPASPGPRRPRPWVWVLAAVLAVAAGGAVLHRDRIAGAGAPGPREAAAPAPAAALGPGEFRLSDAETRALRVEAVTLRELRTERLAEGRIAVNEDRATPVFPPHSGRVVRVQARLGEEVRAGDTLFEMETTDLAGAAGDMLSAADAASKAAATLEQARREEARQNSLFSARAASQRDVEQARTAVATAGADLRAAEAALAAARDKLRVLGRSADGVAQIERTRRVDAVVPVTAPIGGTVTQRRVGPGQWLSAGGGEPVFTIADLSAVWLVAAVRELDAPLIRAGQAAEVEVGALPGRSFEARIATVGAGLDPATRRLTVRAEVRDPERLLKPEMFATFRIAVGEGRQAVAVPAGAVVHRGPEASVWVALDGNRFVRRRVSLGVRSGDLLEVTEGLEAADRVVTGGALFIDRAARID
jgi:cobalt-zinc-cadmium efflux system membrane fusion protein